MLTVFCVYNAIIARAQMFMHAIAHGCCRDIVRESALNVESGRKIPCRTGELNLPQLHAGPTLYQPRVSVRIPLVMIIRLSAALAFSYQEFGVR